MTGRTARQPETEYRALTLFDRLPPNHKTFFITDGRSAPHLKHGEFAVIDTADRVLQNGEVYLVQYTGGPRRRELAQAGADQLIIGLGATEPSPVWWLRDLAGWRRCGDSDGVPVFAGFSDGPYRAEDLTPMLIARVVGYALSSLKGLLAPAAGYENEAAGNAAFDPAEYITALLAAGYRPGVYYDRAGGEVYYEALPDRPAGAAEEAVRRAARDKFSRASTALDRVIDECIRRGLDKGLPVTPRRRRAP